MKTITNTAYAKRIAFLPAHLYQFALQDEDTKQDILDSDLDQEEIESIVTLHYELEHKQKKRKVTMMLSDKTILGLKLKAAQLGIPYQTLINSILHQYVTGQIGK